MQLRQVLQQTGSSALADGGINLNASLVSKGVSEFDVVSNLNGTAGMDLTKVSVASKKGQDGSLLDLLKFLAFLSGSDPSKSLADVVFSSTITNGVANCGLYFLRLAFGQALSETDSQPEVTHG